MAATAKLVLTPGMVNYCSLKFVAKIMPVLRHIEVHADVTFESAALPRFQPLPFKANEIARAENMSELLQRATPCGCWNYLQSIKTQTTQPVICLREGILYTDIHNTGQFVLLSRCLAFLGRG
jgi:hypothetical protein